MRERLRAAYRALKRELRVYQAVRRDPRTPRLAKALLALSIGYLLMPFDLIPDFIPVVGHLDDALIVPGLFLLALRLVPPEVLEDARSRVANEAPR